PPGRYDIGAAAAGRAGPGRLRVTVPAAGPIEMSLGAPGRLDLDVGVAVTGAKAARAPVRVVLRGAAGTPDPDFGGPYSAAGARNSFVSPDGRAARPLAPGLYDVLVTRGPEYDLILERVNVPEGGVATVRGTLARRIDTAGYVAIDPHVHTSASADSGVAPRDRALACAAEGLAAVVVTDHDAAVGLGDAIEALGLRPWLAAVVGTEVTTDPSAGPVGRVAVYPVEPEPAGAEAPPLLPWRGLSFAEVPARARAVSGAVVQVNHPRGGGGVFDLLGLDPSTLRAAGSFPVEFDALEVANGRAFDSTGAAVADWAALVSCGLRVTPTGGSDSHAVAGETCGYPRTYVAAGPTDPRALGPHLPASAIRSGRVVVSTGPFVVLSVNGRGPGETVTTAGRGVLVQIRVEAAPWVDVRRARVMVNGVERLAFSPTAQAPEPVRIGAQEPLALAGDAVVWAEVFGDQPLEPLDPASPIRPWALTGPIRIDLDRDGAVRPTGSCPPGAPR
ncbi:MAG: CehA/McbA family metallohydrolase, partial [Myxococcota bacterium]|nr:CehA/McbA family metallohydrolase [Myxococcota bacterium]